jgi:PAS domain S-box-containing protein
MTDLCDDDLRSLLDSSRNLIGRCSRDLRLRFVNRAVEHLTGRPPEAFVGQSVEEMGLPEELAAELSGALRRVLDSGHAEAIEAICAGPNGGYRFVVQLTPERSPQGDVRSVAFVGRDVTNDHRAELALRASESRYRSVIDTAGSIIVGLRPDHTIFEWNRAAEALFGVSRAVALGQDYLEHFLPAEFREAVAADIRKVLDGTPTIGFEDEAVLPSGERRSLIWNVTRLLASDGLPEGVIALGQDITDRKAIEERFRAFFEQASDAFFVCDERGILDCNEAALRMLRCDDKTRLIGRALSDFSPELQPDGVPSVEKREVVTEVYTRQGRHRFDWLQRRVDGEEFPVEVYVTRIPVRGRAHWLVTWHDLSEREEALRAQQALEAQLRQAQKMEAIGQLAGGVAHDFNNLLTGILSYAELANAELPADSPAHEDLEEVARAARRASALTRQLLTFSRKQVAQPQPLDLNAVVQGALPLLRRVVGEGATVETALVPEVRATWADPGQIEQVLMNLVVNARDAMPKGGTIIIETTMIGGPGVAPRVQLAVRDNGIGMDAALQSRIFEPFFTTKPVGQGTGLGLAVVYGIVTQAGGTIEVDSAPGTGSSFVMRFPVAGPSAGTPAPRLAHLPGGSETIMLVEDEQVLRNATARILQRSGYRVVTARHGADALLAWRAAAPAIDLVVSDLRMPEMGGAELAMRLTADGASVPVLFVTGYAGDGEEVRDLPPGATVLPKPFEAEELLREVRALLDARTSSQT